LKPGEFLQKELVGGTPDFKAYFKTGVRLLEIKTADIRSSHRWTEDEFPDEYMCQVQWYLGLTGIDKAHIAALIGGNDFRDYEVDFSPSFFSKLKARAQDFWHNHVLTQTPPEPQEGDSETASLMFPRASIDTLMAPTMDLENMVAYLAGLKAGVKEREGEIDVLEAKIKLILADKEKCSNDLFSLSWKNNKDSEKTDWKQIASELAEKCPALYADLLMKHTTIKPGPRVFRLNWKGAK
jgi:predicted phage-related endonuclease